jgi:acetolactate synthase regulatory subunit
MTHLDTDVLAEFRAGLITGRRGARITAHLGGCERCTALDQQLAGVRSLLASVPAPTMPDSVAHRLDTVLAAEVAQRHAAGHAAAQGEAAPADQAERAGGDGIRESPTPRRPGGNRGFQRLALRVLAPAAAVVVLGAGVYGLSHLNLGSSSSSAASSTAGGAASTAPSVAAGAESAGHVNGPAAAPSQGAVPRGIARAGFSVVAGQRNLTQANLAQQVRVELLVPASARRTQTPTPQLRGCVAKLADGDTVELVERVHFEGRPATLVVARAGAEDTAWIAAPDCSDTYRHVLATTTLSSGISGP